MIWPKLSEMLTSDISEISRKFNEDLILEVYISDALHLTKIVYR